MTNFNFNTFATAPVNPHRNMDEALNRLRFAADDSAVEDYLTGKSLFVAATELNSDHIFELRPNKTWLLSVKRTHDLKSATSEFEFVVNRDEFGPAEFQPIIYDADFPRPNSRVFITPLAGTDSAEHWGMILDTNYLAHPFWPAVFATGDSLLDAGMITLMAIGSRGAYSNAVLPPQSTSARGRGVVLTKMSNGTEVLASLEARGGAKFDHPIAAPASATTFTKSSFAQPLVQNSIAPVASNTKILPAQNATPNLTAPATTVFSPDVLGNWIVPSDTAEPLLNWDDIRPLPVIIDPTDGIALGSNATTKVSVPKQMAATPKSSSGALQMSNDKNPTPDLLRTALETNPTVAEVSHNLQFATAEQRGLYTEAAALNAGHITTTGGMQLSFAANTMIINIAADSRTSGKDMAIRFITDEPIVVRLTNGQSFALVAANGMDVTVAADGTVAGYLQNPIRLSTVVGSLVLEAERFVTIHPDGQIDLDALHQNLRLHLPNPTGAVRPVVEIAQKPDIILYPGDREPTDADYNTPDLVIYPDGILEGTLAKSFSNIPVGTRVFMTDAGGVIRIPDALNDHFD